MKRIFYTIITTPLVLIWLIAYPISILSIVLVDIIEERFSRR